MDASGTWAIPVELTGLTLVERGIPTVSLGGLLRLAPGTGGFKRGAGDDIVSCDASHTADSS
jgi:hypothetical protein